MINNNITKKRAENFILLCFLCFFFLRVAFLSIILSVAWVLASQDDNELAPRLSLLEMRNHFGKRSANALLVQLRDFPTAAHLTVFAEHFGKLLHVFTTR